MATKQYFQQVILTPAGKLQHRVIPPAQALIQQLFPVIPSDKTIRDTLLHLFYHGTPEQQKNAELCLRCSISHQILRVCIRLERQFGWAGGFNRIDLLARTLDDDIRAELCHKHPTPYLSLAQSTLQSYNPKGGASLHTWAQRRTYQHKDLLDFLKERLNTRWMSNAALLNDTQPAQLAGILSEFCATAIEIQQAQALLQSFHGAYKVPLQQQRSQGYRGNCPAPSSEQYRAIASSFQEITHSRISVQMVQERLGALAQILRQRHPSSQPLDLFEPPAHALTREDGLQASFLRKYQETLVRALDQAIEQGMSNRREALQKKSAERDRKFIEALQFLYLENLSAGAIAPLIGLGGQSQVSRLLKLDDLRSSIHAYLVDHLKVEVEALVKDYVTTAQYLEIKLQLESLLQEEADQIMAEDAAYVISAYRPPQRLFAQRLCCYLLWQKEMDLPKAS